MIRERKAPVGWCPPRPAGSPLPQHRTQQSKHVTTDPLVAYVLLMLASPGALYDRAFVRTCPLCGYGHLHNLMPGEARALSITRYPRCAPHRIYSLVITSVVPASVVPGQPRRGAA
jgi:hypothetical protein